MHLAFLRKLFTHMEWADALVWRVTLGDPAVRGDAFAVDSLVHLHMVQRAHLAAWRGEEILTPTRGDFAGLLEIRDWARAYHPDATAFLDGLREDSLHEQIPLPWEELIEEQIGGPMAPATLGDLMFQVAAHSLHHRAQVNRRIRELGGDPPMVDYIGWVWRGQPDPQWESAPPTGRDR